VYHAQPRHCLQRISSPDHGQLRAPVLEPAGCGVRLDKRPLRSRVFDAGTIWSPVRTGSRNFTTEVLTAVPEPSTWTMLILGFVGQRLHRLSPPQPCNGDHRSLTFATRKPPFAGRSRSAPIGPRRWVSYKMTGWVQIGSMFALRSLGTCAKRLKFLSWKGD